MVWIIDFLYAHRQFLGSCFYSQVSTWKALRPAKPSSSIAFFPLIPCRLYTYLGEISATKIYSSRIYRVPVILAFAPHVRSYVWGKNGGKFFSALAVWAWANQLILEVVGNEQSRTRLQQVLINAATPHFMQLPIAVSRSFVRIHVLLHLQAW